MHVFFMLTHTQRCVLCCQDLCSWSYLSSGGGGSVLPLHGDRGLLLGVDGDSSSLGSFAASLAVILVSGLVLALVSVAASFPGPVRATESLLGFVSLCGAVRGDGLCSIVYHSSHFVGRRGLSGTAIGSRSITDGVLSRRTRSSDVGSSLWLGDNGILIRVGIARGSWALRFGGCIEVASRLDSTGVGTLLVLLSTVALGFDESSLWKQLVRPVEVS